jgi:glycerophosphoryl diester phosphodiesterase
VVKKIVLIAVAAFVVLVLFQALYGGRPGDVPPKDEFDVVAHRGVHVNWKEGTYDRGTGCEATNIYTPTHGYIENTLESIGAAFEMGATVVEIDIRRTSNNQLVIFHDDALECRTDGQGEVSDHPLAYLQSLDIGYGYTHDGGQTYPFRGKGVGKMPTLVEVLQAFPDKKLWIDHKDGSRETAELLVDIVKKLPAEQQRLLYYWGPPEIYEYVHGEIPAVTRFVGIRPQVKQCMMPFLLTLGLRGFPEECAGMGIGLPPTYTKIAWGWPYRFLASVERAGARFYLLIDSAEDAEAFANVPVDGIITDYIEVVGKYYEPREETSRQ